MAEQQRERRKGKKNREERETSEWQERVVQIRRVTKVVKGGKKLSFRAVVVVGNERGQVGVGVGKANDVIGAVRKGVADGKKNLIDVPLTTGLSVPHPMKGSGGGATVLVMPAAAGTGVSAGGAVRTVLELAGVKNSLAKQLGSSNPLNNARATINALSRMRTFEAVAAERGIEISKLFSK
ncbi:MAG: 30S ribosomal protein S5 [Cyanobacteriota bacterium]|nr:30S ribosomal protein S5 [Cyanobacteriota bacterium]